MYESEIKKNNGSITDYLKKEKARIQQLKCEHIFRINPFSRTKKCYKCDYKTKEK